MSVKFRFSSKLLPPFLTAAACSLPGIALCQEATSPPPSEPTIDVGNYRVEGPSPLSDSLTGEVLAPYVGSGRTLRQIEQAAEALEKTLRDNGYVFHRVYIPEQKPAQGEVRLRISSFGIGNVSVSGNENFSTENIRRSVPSLQEGATPDMHRLGQDLTAANANPSKNASVTFREGQVKETVDAEIRIKDAAPLNFFAGYTANRSVDPLSRGDSIYRLSVGVQHSNLFDRDHVATFSYTTDPRDLGRVTLLGIYYQAPFYGTGLSLSGYYTHSDVASGKVQQGGGFFDVSGRGDFYGLRLTQALPRVASIQHSISLAIDDRYFENNTTFSGSRIQPNVGSRPLSARYTVRQDEPWGGYGGNIEYAYNIGGGTANREANYKDATISADYHWSLWRYGIDTMVTNAGWNILGKLRGQWSGNSLIPGEQFGLGGAFSVRGFADREVAGDYGFQWNLEAVAPQMLLPNLRPAVFVDGGQVHTRATGHTENLLSVGAGLRWAHQHLEASVDLAHALDRNNLNPDDIRTRIHLSLLYRF